MIDDLRQRIASGDDLINESLTKANNDQLNAFVTIIEDAKTEKTDSILSGIPYATKDNFSTKGILSTASSASLKDYIPFFDATAIQKLKDAGAVNIGKTVMDELGMGGSGKTGHTGAVKNPWDNERITGGSSAGSCAAVASGIVPFALGSDTGDSIRKPASYCGVVGYKPTYGMISRYGLFAFASSLDHVGVITTSVKNAALVADVIKGIDEKDMTSWDSSNIDLTNSLTGKIQSKKLFYIKEICENNYQNITDETISTLKSFSDNLDKIRALGITVEEINIDKDLLDAIYPAYFTIASAEATSNMANLTGLIFGPRGKGKTAEEMMFNHRTNGFSPLIKRRFIIGSYVLRAENVEKYFFNSARVRKMITSKISDLFKNYDGMILPASLTPAPKSNEKLSDYLKTEQYLAIANFGGFPSITIPSGFVNNMPVGINITSDIKDDENLLNIAYSIEKILSFKNQTTKGGK